MGLIKAGLSDVLGVKYGNLDVDKVMYGGNQLWPFEEEPPPEPFTPTLIDYFAGPAGTTNTTTKSIVVPAGKTIPIKSYLVVFSVVNGVYQAVTVTDNATGAGGSNLYTRRSDSTFIQSTNCFGSINICYGVTREIVAGRTITATHTGANRNRGALVVAWFQDNYDYGEPGDTGMMNGTLVSGSLPWNTGNSSSWSTGGQATDADQSTLDLVCVIGTGSTAPYSFSSGVTKIAEATSTAGSTDRGGALGYRVSRGAGDRSASGSCGNAVWGAGLVPVELYDYVPED